MEQSSFGTFLPIFYRNVTALTGKDLILVGSIILVNIKSRFFRKYVDFIEETFNIEIEDSDIISAGSMFALFYLFTRNLSLAFVSTIAIIAIMFIVIWFSKKEIVSYLDSYGKKHFHFVNKKVGVIEEFKIQ